MNFSVHLLAPGLHLDARHALWIEDHRALVVADLHLGYVWAHRHSGQLFPITAPDDTIERLVSLASEYQPAQIILLGDIVHAAVPVPALREQLEMLARQLTGFEVRWVGGNHDRRLPALLHECGLSRVRLEPEVRLGPQLLIHGDQSDPTPRPAAGLLIMGHEHPAIPLHDGVTTSVKCPCFLAGPNILVLPAFSQWAAGSNIRSSPFLSSIAREAQFMHAYAILGKRILRVAL